MKVIVQEIYHTAKSVVYVLDYRDIKDQPTAYYIDGVVGQLKTDSSVKLYGSGNSNNYLIPLEKAIEIVKAGGTCQ